MIDRSSLVWLRRPLLIGLALTLIILASVLGSLHWIEQNVVLVGRDSSGHLERTVKAAEILNHFSPQTLFAALTLHDYRPPGLYLAAQPFYWLFGVGMDSAQLLNVTLLALILFLTFVLAAPIVGQRVALFAALLLSLLPMLASMSRLFYMENLLTTLLLINLIALLRCGGFARRGWTLLWGASLGLALLVKWTSPIYVMLPVLYVLWQSNLRTAVRRQSDRGERAPTEASSHPALARQVLAAAGAGGLFLALWVWPNRASLDEFLLGAALPVLWFLLAAVLVFALQRPSSPTANLSASLLLAAALASLWYLPHIDFLNRLSDVAFGTDRGNQEPVNLLRLSNYTRYVGFWVREHMGPLPTLLIVPAALAGWLVRLPRWRTARLGIVVLWLTLLSTYLFLTFLAQANPRNLAPLLPVIAILLAESLTAYPRRWAIGLGSLWVAVLAVQWSIYTFDGMEPFYRRSPALWVSGDYMAWPSTGSTDPAYWIQPDVLATIGSVPGKPARLGMLVDSWELHRGSFRYLIAAGRLNIDLMSLTEPEGRGWSDLLANEWVLLKNGDNSGVREPGLGVLRRIEAGDPLFAQLYQEVKRYPLPSGEVVTLYHRPQGPRHLDDFPVLLISTARIADAINAWWSAAATLFFPNADVATWVGIHDLKADRVLLPQTSETSLEAALDGVTGTLLAATRYDTPAVQELLRRTSYVAAEVSDGEFTVTAAGRPGEPLAALFTAAAWPDIQIDTLRTLPVLHPGEVLPVELAASGRVDGSAKVSLRLLDAQGQPVAQRDDLLLSEVRLGLLLPPVAAPGVYTLAAVLYDPATLAPIPDREGRTLTPLAEIEVTAPPPARR